MSGLPTTPQYLRGEIARHQIKRGQISAVIGMHPNMISDLINERRSLAPWAAHNLGYAVNAVTGLSVFHVDMRLGVLGARTPIDKLR